MKEDSQYEWHNLTCGYHIMKYPKGGGYGEQMGWSNSKHVASKVCGMLNRGETDKAILYLRTLKANCYLNLADRLTEEVQK